jgi:DDE superfamily endonuclease
VVQLPADHAFVRTTKPKAAAAARIGAALARRKQVELLGLLRPCFARTGPWLQAGKYAAALISQIPRRNGWTIAAHVGQLAAGILAEAFADGVRLDFVCGDEVYGSCTQLREYLEDRGQAYVLRVPSSFRLTLAGGNTLTCQQAAARLTRRAGRSARPGPGQKDTAGRPGRGWPPPRPGITC